MTERDENGGAGCFIMGGVAFIMLAPYILSIGPVFWLVQRNPGLQWIGVIYFPIGLMEELFPPFASVIQWYLDFWR